MDFDWNPVVVVLAHSRESYLREVRVRRVHYVLCPTAAVKKWETMVVLTCSCDWGRGTGAVFVASPGGCVGLRCCCEHRQSDVQA